MRLVVGLGNPGERYAPTRHNVAWRVLDRLEGRWDGPARTVAGAYVARRVRIRGDVVELMRPTTFMNLSGEALARWRDESAQEFEAGQLLVVTDDIYLPLGALRLRAGGSSGGHRGLESIEEVLGSREFARLRLGVGEAANAPGLREHVLEAFTPDEEIGRAHV